MADGVLFDYKTGGIAVVSFRRQHSRRIRPNHDLPLKESYHAVRDLEGPVQLDGTLYELLYRGDAEMSITVPGCEVGSDCSKDIPLVRWMDNVRRAVEKMVDQAAKAG